tara:strand:- start:1666 stop:2142 length:477 start_codon:yes stop_codon:yes gene_type:complete
MLLSALSNYLQHQHASTATNADNDATKVDAISNINTKAADDSASPAAYVPSNRAVLVSAVASEFNVQALPVNEVGGFQARLQQYGLLNGQALNALALVNTAREGLAENDTIDALGIIDLAKTQFDELGASYSQRKQVSQLHTLFSNLASARPVAKMVS